MSTIVNNVRGGTKEPTTTLQASWPDGLVGNALARYAGVPGFDSRPQLFYYFFFPLFSHNICHLFLKKMY